MEKAKLLSSPEESSPRSSQHRRLPESVKPAPDPTSCHWLNRPPCDVVIR